MEQDKKQQMINELLDNLKHVKGFSKKDLTNNAILDYAFKKNTAISIKIMNQYKYDCALSTYLSGAYGGTMDRWLEVELQALFETYIESGMKTSGFIETLEKFNANLKSESNK